MDMAKWIWPNGQEMIMDNATRHCLLSYLSEITERFNAETARLEQLGDYLACRMKTKREGNCVYYYVLEPNENSYKYLGTDNHEHVLRIKEARYLQLSVKEMQREIRLLNDLLHSSRDISHEAIEQKLRSVYRGSSAFLTKGLDNIARQWVQSSESLKSTFPPFRPEELIHTTRDGTMVRSRGEALIYNYLSEIGVPFVYELPLRIRIGNKNSLLLPDFTILSEIDYERVIYIEHQGMMDDPKYRNGFNEKVFRYWSNNYIPERDVFFTFDLPNGGTDDTAIKSIIRRYIRPGITDE